MNHVIILLPLTWEAIVLFLLLVFVGIFIGVLKAKNHLDPASALLIGVFFQIFFGVYLGALAGLEMHSEVGLLVDVIYMSIVGIVWGMMLAVVFLLGFGLSFFLRLGPLLRFFLGFASVFILVLTVSSKLWYPTGLSLAILIISCLIGYVVETLKRNRKKIIKQQASRNLSKNEG